MGRGEKERERGRERVREIREEALRWKACNGTWQGGWN